MMSYIISRSPGYVSVGSLSYDEWQNLEFEATTELERASNRIFGASSDPPVVSYPKKILTHREKREREMDVSQMWKIVSQPGVADTTKRKIRVNTEYREWRPNTAPVGWGGWTSEGGCDRG